MELKTWALVIISIILVGTRSINAESPPWHQIEPVNMGHIVNTEFRDSEPSFTADGKTMYFNCIDRVPGAGYDICVSYLEDGKWTEPEIVGYPINTEYHEVQPLISRDGNTMYVTSNRLGGYGSCDIWVSHKVNSEWIELENLGPPINSPYADHCLHFTGPDENIAYWTSTRPGGYGGNDIWTSRRVNGVWQEAVNLGPNVNSPYNDHHSLPSPDGKSLYITSERPGGYGGEDIYVTTMDTQGVWGPLKNLGPLVNSDKNDRCPAFTSNFKEFVFSSERDGGHGSKDLWWIYYENIKHIQ